MKHRSLKEDIKVLEQALPPKRSDGFLGSNVSSDEASLVLLPAPFEATVSFGEGSANATDGIRVASHQLDLQNFYYQKPYAAGISMLKTDKNILKLSNKARKKALKVIEAIENGSSDDDALAFVNKASKTLNDFIYNESLKQLNKDRFVAVIGGDHSTPFGLIKALNDTQKESFGILHLDAHHDLREAYEGFTYSHASIFYNVLNECQNVSKLVQIGIRDYSKEESKRAKNMGERVACLYDSDMQSRLAGGQNLEDIFNSYIKTLPDLVYLSIDIDALEPSNCPNTGTPVPSGLRYAELEFLLALVVKSQKKIIGFDLCEVGTSKNGWDENVGARVLYNLCGALLASQKKIALKG